MKRVHVGCGPNILEGWVNVDVCAFTGVDVVAPADNLPFLNATVDEMMAEHLIEHLTFFEFNRALAEWHRVLKSGGNLTLECPDLLGLCCQFIGANEYGRYDTYRGYWPLIAHFYGHQRGKSEAEIMGQVHKSGYTEEHLHRVLTGAGFHDIEFVPPQRQTPHSPVLRVVASKV